MFFRKRKELGIAVIGYAGKFPGAKNTDDFWLNLSSGRCSISTVPTDRWDLSSVSGMDLGAFQGGFIDGVFLFDHGYFKLSKNRALLMAPQNRLFLEVAALAVNHAGYAKKELNAKKVGIYVGTDNGDYGYTIQPGGSIGYDPLIYDDKNGVIGNVYSNIAATLVSKHFNTHGPSLALTSACSSSLVAIHLACQSLIHGECEMALAGASQIHLSPFPFLCASRTGVLSSDALTRTFSPNANGYALSEGVGCVILKKLDRAIEDGDSIHAVVKGSAVNNDGKTMSILLANPEAQKNVIKEAVDKAGVSAAQISYLEVNGTAMPVGDPLEVKAAAEVFAEFSQQKQYCAMGSIEPNVGHMVNASGIGRFIKVLKALEHKKIPPFIYAEDISPDIEINKTPFYINGELSDWQPVDERRIAGISAFGFGGTNSHIILEEFVPEKYKYYQQHRSPLDDIEFKYRHLNYLSDNPQEKRLGHTVQPIALAPLSPLLHKNISDFSQQRFESSYSGEEFFLDSHQVSIGEDAGKTKILPGVVYLEIARSAFVISSAYDIDEAAAVPVLLKNIVWRNALKVECAGDRKVYTSLSIFETNVELGNAGDNTFGREAISTQFEISSIDAFEDAEATDSLAHKKPSNVLLHASGELMYFEPGDEKIVPLASLQKEINANEFTQKQCYQAFNRLGIHYGDSHQGLVSLKLGQSGTALQALARITLPDVVKNTHGDYLIHPSIFDSALQLCIALSVDIEEILDDQNMQLSAPALPFSLEKLYLYQQLPQSCFAWARKIPSEDEELGISYFDIDLCDEQGKVFASIEGFATKSLSSNNSPRSAANDLNKRDPNKSSMRAQAAKKHVNSSPAAYQSSQTFRQLTLDYLAELFSGTMGVAPSELESDAPFERYQIDSMMIVDLNNKIAKAFGNVPRTLFFEYQNLEELADYFMVSHAKTLNKLLKIAKQTSVESHPPESQVAPAVSAGATSFTSAQMANNKHASKSHPVSVRPSVLKRSIFHKVNESAPPKSRSVVGDSAIEPMAIVGLSGRYPQAPTLDQFWKNLKDGKECVAEIPSERWPLEGFYNPDAQDAAKKGMSYCKWGAMLEGFAEFDPLFFNISPREAINIDPQERLFLQACWQALEDAGYTRADLERKYNKQVGVFAGITKTGFDLYGPELWRLGDNRFPRSSFPSVANRVSYFFNIHGPSYPIDTMCSSSLTAIHEASRHIHMGECEIAIVGGVNLYLHPANYVALSSGFMLSGDGHCRSFGEGANGFIPGEGVGAIILKPLSRALADRDNVHAVVIGSSVNHGGKTSGYTVPSPRAQAELVKTAISRAGISAADISYIEAHGTGTELGDPIEFSGLSKAFRAFDAPEHGCALGSIKSNIGHLEAAAGMAGLTKIILQMKHQTLVPSLNAQQTNPNIDFEGSPFVLNKQLNSWEVEGKPRIAGVSSFGSGGANAHVLLREYIPQRTTPQEEPVAVLRKVAVLLSAKNEQSLQRQLHNLSAHLENTLAKKDYASDASQQRYLRDLAFTLQLGRESMAQRFACIVSSLSELKALIKQVLADEKAASNTIFASKVSTNDPSLTLFNSDKDAKGLLDKWVTRADLTKILPLWVKGVKVNWHLLYQDIPEDQKPYRISLPTYSFESNCYWFPDWVHAHNKKGYGSHSIQGFPTQGRPILKQSGEQANEKEFETDTGQPDGGESSGSDTTTGPVHGSAELDHLLIELIAEHLKIENRELIDFECGLDEYGLDSIVSVHMINQLGEVFPELPRSLFMEYISLEEVKAYLQDRYPQQVASLSQSALSQNMSALNKVTESEPRVVLKPDSMGVKTLKQGIVKPELFKAVNLKPENRTTTNKENPGSKVNSVDPQLTASLAIIGLAGLYPHAENIWELWQKLESGQDLTGPVSKRRLQLLGLSDEQANQKSERVGGFIHGVEYFDHQRFKLSREEARQLDPQLRKLLELGWKAIADAGYQIKSFRKKKTGVYVAANGDSGYQSIAINQRGESQQRQLLSVLANRISHSFNFHGPSEAVESGCSGFLNAIKRAATDLRLGRCEYALVACSDLSLFASEYIREQKEKSGNDVKGLYSRQSRTKSFSIDSGGYIKSESMGAIVLKRADIAEKDGDPIYALIKGIGISHGGKAPINWFSPNVGGQVAAIEEALYEANIDPVTVSYIEPEANGSQLGDAAEIIALQKVYGAYVTQSEQNGETAEQISISSLKPQTGHAEAASTFPVLVKMLMSMRNKRMLKVKGLEKLNTGIKLKKPFDLLKQNRPWINRHTEAGEPRRGAIHSMSIGGVNAHMIVEEYQGQGVDKKQAENNRVDNAGKVLCFIFSDETPEQLKAMMARYVDYLQANPDIHLPSLAHSLILCRENFSERLVVLANNYRDLKNKIRSWLMDHEALNSGIISRATSEQVKALELSVVEEREMALAWVDGKKNEWSKTIEAGVQRLNLPHNELRKVFCWHQGIEEHNLMEEITSNTSDIGTLSFTPHWIEKELRKSEQVGGREKEGDASIRRLFICDWPGDIGFQAGYRQDIEFICLHSEGKDPAERFLDYAKQLFLIVKRALTEHPKVRQVFQLVLPDNRKKAYLIGLAGLFKTAAKEGRKISGQLVLVDDNASLEKMIGLADDNLTSVEDVMIRYEAQQRMVLSWSPQENSNSPSQYDMNAIYKEQGIYLITGGLGGLGYIFSKEIARAVDHPKIILTGRSALSDEKQQRMESLQKLGATVEYYQSDVSNYDEVVELIDQLLARYGSLNGIIHSAGVLRDSYIVEKSVEDLQTVLTPKVNGVYNLDQCTKALPIDFFVLFSSMSAIYGNYGQADYSMGNAFMDGYVRYRNALVEQGSRSGRTVTMNWPLWEDGGMSIDENIKEYIKNKFHMIPLPTEEGVNLMNMTLSEGTDQCLVKYGVVNKLKEDAPF